MKPANRISIVHGVECGHFVHPHGWHLQHSCNLVHDADTGEAMLSLSEVQQRHHGGLFILAGVSTEYLLDELLILLVELERNGEIVFGGIAVLGRKSSVPPLCAWNQWHEHTTLRLSLRAATDTLNARLWCLVTLLNVLPVFRSAHGASLPAIVRGLKK
jgi:hypothetical protein